MGTTTTQHADPAQLTIWARVAIAAIQECLDVGVEPELRRPLEAACRVLTPYAEGR